MDFVTRRLPLIAALAAVLLSWPALAQKSPSSPSAERPAAPKQPIEVIPAANDRQIAGRLTSILKATGWFSAPQVTVRDGVVFLDGRTDSAEHRDWASDLAQSTEGTVAVVNRIEPTVDVSETFRGAADEVVRFAKRVVSAWPYAALIFVIFLMTWGLVRLVGMLMRRFLSGRIHSPLLFVVLVRASAIPVLILGLYFTLQVVGLTGLALTVLGGTGLIGIIIGFAFRDIAENFLASLLLSVRNPFSRGDLIEVAGHTGIVQNLNTRSTILLTQDGNHVLIPNATVYKSSIINFSSIASRRAEFVVGIAYDSSATKAQQLIYEILKNHRAVLATPEPLVLVDELGEATVNLRVTYWFDSAIYSPVKISSALMRLTKDCLLANGIELPDAAREVIFPKGVPLARSRALRPDEEEPAAMRDLPTEQRSDATENDLSAEPADLSLLSGQRNVPEGEENLLKQ